MSRPRRYRLCPPRDAVVTSGEMIVFLPEHDKTGNALNVPPLTQFTWGRTLSDDLPTDQPPGTTLPPPEADSE